MSYNPIEFWDRLLIKLTIRFLSVLILIKQLVEAPVYILFYSFDSRTGHDNYMESCVLTFCFTELLK
jgi:hypothetical protein